MTQENKMPRTLIQLLIAPQIGFPMKEALWRTNHGYDPTIRQHFGKNKERVLLTS